MRENVNRQGDAGGERRGCEVAGDKVGVPLDGTSRNRRRGWIAETVKRASLGGGGLVPCGGGEEELVSGVRGGECVSGDGVGHVRLDEDEEVIRGGVDAVDALP